MNTNVAVTRQDLFNLAKEVRTYLEDFESNAGPLERAYWLDQATSTLAYLTKLSLRYESLAWYHEYSK